MMETKTPLCLIKRTEIDHHLASERTEIDPHYIAGKEQVIVIHSFVGEFVYMGETLGETYLSHIQSLHLEPGTELFKCNEDTALVLLAKTFKFAKKILSLAGTYPDIIYFPMEDNKRIYRKINPNHINGETFGYVSPLLPDTDEEIMQLASAKGYDSLENAVSASFLEDPKKIQNKIRGEEIYHIIAHPSHN